MPPLVERKFKRKDTYVISTLIALDVLRHHGYTARPMVVSLMNMNAKEWECLEEAWASTIRDHPGIVPYHLQGMIGRNSLEGVMGHMIALQGNTMIDLASGQFARPEKGINPPQAMILKNFSAEAGKCNVYEHDNKMWSILISQPENKSYLSSNWWNDRALRRDIVMTTIERLNPKPNKRRKVVRMFAR